MNDRSNRGYYVLYDLVESGQLVANTETHSYDFADPSQPLKLSGVGNFKPRQEFADKLAGLSDEEFLIECEHLIWLSAYAANNPISDYHWQCDACYHEAQRRGKAELYDKAWHQASGM